MPHHICAAAIGHAVGYMFCFIIKTVVSVLETTAADGKNYPTRYYNLDAIIAVGYRVNSKKATMFRIWANRILKEYIIKGYVMDDERLKEPQNFFGKDYFETKKRRTAP